jgi:hypothetical protein
LWNSRLSAEQNATMNATPLPRDRLHAAEAEVVGAKAELEAACEQARREVTATDWLAARPDLRRLAEVIEDLPRRQSLYKQASAQCMAICKERIGELSPKWGIGCPAEIDSMALFYHQVIRAVWYHDVRIIPQSMIHDPGLDLSSKAQLASAIQAAADLIEAQDALSRRGEIAQFLSSQIDTYAADKTREEKAIYDAAVKASLDARRDCIAQFQQQLECDFPSVQIEDFVPVGDHALRRQLQNIRDRYEHVIQEKQRRAWWEQVTSHPISSVVRRLSEVPGECVQQVLDALLRLPATDPHIHSEEVHGFLRSQYERLAKRRILPRQWSSHILLSLSASVNMNRQGNS